jgi:hypothetical protein
MKTFEVDLKRAVFGWPYYTALNLVGYTLERKGRARNSRLLGALLFWVITTGAWAAVWETVVWLMILLVTWSDFI